MAGFHFGSRSLKVLAGINPDLRDVCMRAIEISRHDIAALNGLRTEEEQTAYVAAGKSRTMNSRHLTGHAIDLGVYLDGRLVWEPWDLYEELAETMFQAAHIEGKVIEWGGHFGSVRLDGRFIPYRDGVHFQLPWQLYL